MSLADRGVMLPRAPGHEITGRVVAIGPEAEGVAAGDLRIVYPWIGCGRCARCLAGEDNLCLAQRSLGVLENGGFNARVKVPHPWYLVAFDGLDPSVAATYACSGITVLSAIRKVMPLRPDEPVLLIGAGGLGLAAIAMLRALDHRRIISLDLSPEKLRAAEAAGATDTVDGTGDDVVARIVAAAGGAASACAYRAVVGPTPHPLLPPEETRHRDRALEILHVVGLETRADQRGAGAGRDRDGLGQRAGAAAAGRADRWADGT